MNNARTSLYRFRDDSPFRGGLEAGGKFLVQGSLVLGRHGCTVPASALYSEIDLDIAERQESLIEDFSRSQSCWFDNPHQHYKAQGYLFYGYGGEAQVYTESDKFVHKICRITQYGYLNRFFDRLIIENTICPFASLEIEGFGRLEDGTFVVLLRQRFFRQAKIMTESEISLYMRCLGFRREEVTEYHTVRYVSDSVIVEDLHPSNIWMTEDDNVVIIDAAFYFNDIFL